MVELTAGQKVVKMVVMKEYQSVALMAERLVDNLVGDSAVKSVVWLAV